LPILSERGYLIPAVNTAATSYTDCAEQLCLSIKQWHPAASVSIMTNDTCNQAVFDHVIQLPRGDLGGYANDWQVFAASPYRQTLKLEADMIVASPVDHLWAMFEHRDVVISQGCRDFYDQPGSSRRYRKLFDVNGLPDVYNAVTYWRVSKTAQEFFKLVRVIFEQWSSFKTLLKFPEDTPSTDVVYAMAADIMGREQVTLPVGYGPAIVHMKQGIVPIQSANWTKELVWENTNPGVRINTIAQWGFVHYHNKEWRLE
jgi:hypothetical protein